VAQPTTLGTGFLVFLVVVVQAVLALLLVRWRFRRRSQLSVLLIETNEEGMEMEITTVAVEIGSAKSPRIVGRTRAGKDHALENIVLSVIQNPERFTVELVAGRAKVTALALPGDEAIPPNPDTGDPGSPGVQDGDSSLTGAFKLEADGRIGTGVRPIAKTFGCVAVLVDAVDAVLEDDDPALELGL